MILAVGQRTPCDRQWFEHQLIEAVPLLRSVARKFHTSRDDIDDLVQETLCKALDSHCQFDAERPLLPWLRAVMRNQFISVYRTARQVMIEFDDDFCPEAATEPVQDFAILQRDVYMMIEALPPAQMAALMAISLGASYQEASNHLNSPVNTVKTNVRRARQGLAQRRCEVFPTANQPIEIT